MFCHFLGNFARFTFSKQWCWSSFCYFVCMSMFVLSGLYFLVMSKCWSRDLKLWKKLHKVPFKHHFLAGSSKCTTKDLSCLLTKVLTTVKYGLIRYNNTKTSSNGVNSRWVVKNSTSRLSSLDQLDVRTAISVQTYDFSTLYTSIPHNLLKFWIIALIHNSFKRRNESNRYTHIKIMSGKGYFIDTINPGGNNQYTADQICRMVEFLIDNIFVKLGGCLCCQVIGIPMGTNCAPLLADLFLYYYESEFLDNMIRGGHRKLARSFNLCYWYTDDLIVFNNKKFGDYVKEIYPSQLTVDKSQHIWWPSKLPGLDLHYREQQSTLHQALWQRWWFWFPHCQFCILFEQYSI